eukprot:CAMPEP_0180795862 /NCGR_PEP_ID=MMETSP1038_2-20121128/56451_1 /TAXON_ID=632150 /ORGANISM="Azadinium spinosum, Strain 3D9" /LENGTH=91 /DNA_ID=CAMNT_0022834861 /DNA_START=170 /DNA_END=445 /DNA_ORIENTATION=-
MTSCAPNFRKYSARSTLWRAARTWKPASLEMRATTSFPMRPVAPVTRTFVLAESGIAAQTALERTLRTARAAPKIMPPARAADAPKKRAAP